MPADVAVALCGGEAGRVRVIAERGGFLLPVAAPPGPFDDFPSLEEQPPMEAASATMQIPDIQWRSVILLFLPAEPPAGGTETDPLIRETARGGSHEAR
jgi:hypothetical protein